jgi:hypothetical protein
MVIRNTKPMKKTILLCAAVLANLFTSQAQEAGIILKNVSLVSMTENMVSINNMVAIKDGKIIETDRESRLLSNI